ncbi:hypothetical protein D1007_55674 [Hordeum vulgare]|nr:hypothetical protein D1007_55674 [Hordeum vulgare]
MLVYHYYLATRTCKHFARFVNSAYYRFAMLDTTNDLKREEDVEDSLVDLAVTIIDLYYRDMKVECDKDKSIWHKAWVNELYEEHIKYVTKDAYTRYEMYRRIIDMRNYLLPAEGEG